MAPNMTSRPLRFRGRLGFGLRGVVAIVAIVGAVLLGASRVLPASPRPLVLTSGTDSFTITGQISSDSGTLTPDYLYPGAQRFLWYTVANPLDVSINVTSLAIDQTQIIAPTGCPATNLDLRNTSFTGMLTVVAHSTNSVALPIEMYDNGDQTTACAGKTFTFGSASTPGFIGTATYNEMYGTTAAVGSSGTPSSVGQTVTYTATVTANQAPNQDPMQTAPTGSLTFYDGSTPICSSVPVTQGTVVGTSAKSTATCNAVYGTLGTHQITATYVNSDGNFTGTTSPAFVQAVGSATRPPQCTGQYQNTFIGSASHTITGTNGNDLIFAFAADYTVNGLNGNDCIDAGDGTNALADGDGNTVLIAGNGTNTIKVGNGPDYVQVGNGNDNRVTVGSGPDTIILGNGSDSAIVVGNGPTTVTVGSGNSNTITLGSGPATVTIQGGSHDTITGGNGSETVYLGTGTYNVLTGGSGPKTCHIPAGYTVASQHDTVPSSCKVVSP